MPRSHKSLSAAADRRISASGRGGDGNGGYHGGGYLRRRLGRLHIPGVHMAIPQYGPRGVDYIEDEG